MANEYLIFLENIIRQSRAAKCCTLEQLAEPCGISGRCISNIEHGKSDSKFTTICKICRQLDIDMSIFNELKKAGEPSAV